MKSLFTKKKATGLILTMCCMVLIYHILIITQVIPYSYVWGGKLQSVSEMYKFETVSIVINLLIITTTTVHTRLLQINIPNTITSGLLWVLVFLLLGNTIANLFSESIWETVIFTPVTLILALSCWRLLIKD